MSVTRNDFQVNNPNKIGQIQRKMTSSRDFFLLFFFSLIGDWVPSNNPELGQGDCLCFSQQKKGYQAFKHNSNLPVIFIFTLLMFDLLQSQQTENP